MKAQSPPQQPHGMPQGRAVRPATGTLGVESGNVVSACTDAPGGAQSEITVSIPLPPRELLPNNTYGKPWYVLNRHKTQAQRDAAYAWHAATGGTSPYWKAVTARAVYTFPNRRSIPDSDALISWLKWTRDMLAIGIGIDDKHWRWEPPEVEIVKGAAGVEITIREGAE